MAHCPSPPIRIRGLTASLPFVLATLSTSCTSATPDSDALILGFLEERGSAESGAALAGARFGTAEAAHAAELVGRRVKLEVETVSEAQDIPEAVRRLVRRGATAVLGGFETTGCRVLASAAAERGILFLNLGCTENSLRSAAPHGIFHIAVSDSVAGTALTGGAETAEKAVLWHEDLERFGAGQLNDRLRQGGVRPSAAAWTGWMAVKVLWESHLATQSRDPRTLASHLLDEATAFDGHKGERLRFDPTSRQLRQPTYLVDARGQPTGGGTSGAPSTRAPDLSRPLHGDAYVFVSNEGSQDVSVIDGRTHQIVATIPVPARPRGIHASPDGGRLYIALSDDAPLAEGGDDAILAFDLRKGTVVAAFRAGSDPEQFVVDPSGRFMVAANEDAGTATVTDLLTGESLATLVVGIEPEGIAASPDGRWVYVAAETSNTVSVIDMDRHAIVASFLVDSRPRGVAFSPTRPYAYVTNEISGTLSVIDTRSHRVAASVLLDPTGVARPVGVVVAPDGTRIYVATGHANSVAVIDAETLEILAEVEVGRRPWGIALNADGTRLYTANGVSNDVSVVDTRTLTLVGTIGVGERPWGVALSPDW